MFVTSASLSSMPSLGAGCFLTANEVDIPVVPAAAHGSMATSTPRSKTWPKKVNSELNGGDRPTSVVMFGMKSVLWDGTQPAGTPATAGGPGSGSVVHAITRSGFAWVRTGLAATSTAAGFVEV